MKKDYYVVRVEREKNGELKSTVYDFQFDMFEAHDFVAARNMKMRQRGEKNVRYVWVMMENENEN